jgi:DNA ligase (NAD+)
MNEKQVQKIYLEKIRKFEPHNYYYYEKNEPKISDAEYDKLKKEIQDLEKKYPFLTNKFSPSINVGYKPSKIFKKVSHKVPMLSLGNIFSEEDLINFEKKN